MLIRVLLTILALCGGLLPAVAQDRFILVIDGSSSMWGQVGGETKIEVLRRSLGQVLGQLDTTADVGVVAFGHREKGNCADIEELVPPQPFDATLIQAAIDSIQPKGKTPLSDAVRFAAEGMRFTEEKATVVILGDGGENCSKDPCAVAEELEKTGVDLTVHAIAFDIADQEGSAQLQCFASATGGLFLPVADAQDLVAALETVQKVVETPKPLPVRIEAVDATTGAPLDVAVDWTLTDRAGGQPQPVPGSAAAVEVSLMPGDYDLRAAVGDIAVDAGFSVGPGQPAAIQVAVPRPVAIVLDPSDPATGAPVEVPLDWQITEVSTGRVQTAPGLVGPVEIPLMPGDYTARVTAGGAVAEVAFTVGKGFPVSIPVGIAVPKPAQVRLVATDPAGQPVAGPVAWSFTDIVSFEVIDIQGESGTVSDTVPPGTYDVIAEAAGASGKGQVTVAASGVTEVALVLAPPTAQVRLVALDIATGAPVVADALIWTFVNLATEEVIEVSTVPNGGTTDAVPPGDYDVIVEAGGGFGQAQASVGPNAPPEVMILVAMPEAPLVVSATSVAAGDPVEVRWNFDGRASDLVFILPEGDRDNVYPLDDLRRHEVGTTRAATLTAPAFPGLYEVRYFSQDAGLVHRVPLTVLSPGGSLVGPSEVMAGEIVDVTWTGPGLEGDFVFVAPYDWKDDAYPISNDERVPVSAGNPARVPMPEREGQYEYRYFSLGGGGVLFRAAVSVVAPTARVSAPASVAAGSVFEVGFSGPKDAEDRLFIAVAGSEAERYVLDSAARDLVQAGPPAALVAPVAPGDYEVRYYSLNKGGLLASASFTVTPAQVEIDAPRLVQRASDFDLRVRGPMAPGDIVFVAPKDWEDNTYPLYSEGQLVLGPEGGGIQADGGFLAFTTVAPAEPGAYEIRYFSWANGTVLERRVLVVK